MFTTAVSGVHRFRAVDTGCCGAWDSALCMTVLADASAGACVAKWAGQIFAVAGFTELGYHGPCGFIGGGM